MLIAQILSLCGVHVNTLGGQLGVRKDETGGSPVKCLIQKESYKTVTAVACGSEFTTIILDECKLYVFGRLSARDFTCHPLLVTIPLMSRELLTGVHCGAEHAILVTSMYYLKATFYALRISFNCDSFHIM